MRKLHHIIVRVAHMHTCESVIIKFTMVYAHTKSVTVLKIFNEDSVHGPFLELMMF